MGASGKNELKKFQKSYFDVLGLCCSSEVPLIEKILKSLEGVKDVSIVVPTKTVIVIHDNLLLSQLQIVKALNQAKFEANVKVYGQKNFRNKWPSPYSIICCVLLLLSLIKYAYPPFRWLALGAVAVGILPILSKAFAAARNLRIDINILVLIAVAGSIVLKDYIEAGTIVFLFTIADWLESRASHKATAIMSSWVNVVPQRAVLANTGEEVDADQVTLNTIIAVKSGEVIPIDGVVVDGNCDVDEKILTGESFPVSKQKGSNVYASTINVNGYISIKTTAVTEDCLVARMVKLVEDAQSQKSRTQRIMDKCAKYYTPAIVAISAGLAIAPVAFRLHNKKEWFRFALVVLVSGCPCALLLSTPVAMFCALTKAATLGLLFKGAEYIETLAEIKIMAFDKTGTVTKGEFVVSDFRSLRDDIDLNTLIYWVSSIESKSSHPMAAALIDFAGEHSIDAKPEKVEKFQNFPGEGIFGKIEGKEIYVGNQKISTRAGCVAVPSLEGKNIKGKSVGYIFLGASPAGIFSLSDVCRTGAKEALEELKSMGIKTVMLTGDSHEAAMDAQDQLGGAFDDVHAELLPEDKARIVQELEKDGPTAMIGDGVNDAPALATAKLGISMGVSGSPLATETGHLVLMTNDIKRIPKAAHIARNVRRKIIQNMFFSVTTKAAILGLALGGHPLVWAAVLADVGTSVVVILNSMLILRGTPTRGKECCQSKAASHVHQHKCSTEKNGCSSHDHKHSPHSLRKSQGKCKDQTCSSKKCGSARSCGSKKCSDPAEQHGCSSLNTPPYEAENLGRKCCNATRVSQDLESQNLQYDSCREHSSCSKDGECANSAEMHDHTVGKEGHNEAEHCEHNHHTTETAAEYESSKNHCSGHQCTGIQKGDHCKNILLELDKKCCMDTTPNQDGHATVSGHNSKKCSGTKACSTSMKVQGGCCDNYRKECCIRGGVYGTSTKGSLQEIVIE